MSTCVTLRCPRQLNDLPATALTEATTRTPPKCPGCGP